MSFILLQANALSPVASGVASYLPFVTALCYALAGVICVVGCTAVYLSFVNGDLHLRQKIMKVCFACLFFVTSAHALPLFFGLDGSVTDISSGGGRNHTGDDFSHFGEGHEIDRGGIYVIELPNGGTAIIHPSVSTRV